VGELREKQSKFAVMIAQLILRARAMGYEVTLGEAWRPPETAAIYAAEGKGIANSLHIKRLAIDLNLFFGDKYLTDSEDYRPLGDVWRAWGGSWGGDFAKPDGNHFSLEHEGIR
jgi:hypothetical protein